MRFINVLKLMHDSMTAECHVNLECVHMSDEEKKNEDEIDR